MKFGSKLLGKRRKVDFSPPLLSKENREIFLENMRKMNRSPEESEGMDVLIISTNHPEVREYWKKRLFKTRQFLIKPSALVFFVLEDWPQGAGNGLGTLYALQEANKQCQDILGVDLFRKLKDGSSIAIYHTAGLGQRAAPLSTSEQNNKPAVKLPGFLGSPSEGTLITILEAVIKQTSILARKGRISVFWGDQVFVPSRNLSEISDAYVDILARFEPTPNREGWEKKQWEKYGLCASDFLGHSQIIEKIDFSTFEHLVKKQKIHAEGGIGTSLGCFSLSHEIALALLEEFDEELRKKKGKLDSDPHFWMPMTLDEETFVEIMQKKGTSASESHTHFERMQKFLHRFLAVNSKKPFFKAVDIGRQSFWWDYGTLANYYENTYKLTQKSFEADVMRDFFLIKSDSHSEELTKDSNSCLINCRIASGTIHNSVLIGVVADTVDVRNSVIINAITPHLKASQSLLYDVIDENSLDVKEGTVRSDTFLISEERVPLTTTFERDGKADWKIRLPGNQFSYEEMHQHNQNNSYEEIEKIKQRKTQQAIEHLTN